MPVDGEVLLNLETSPYNRRQYLAIVAALGGPALAGCLGGDDDDDTGNGNGDGEPSHGGHLVSSIETPVTNLDPHYPLILSGYTVAYHAVENLFAWDAEMNLRQHLANDLDVSDDGMTWHIELEEGVQFHPPYQREMVADDVVFNFDRISDPESGSGWVGALQAVESWEAEDDYTVRMDFHEPSSSTGGWMGYRAGVVISPDAIEDMGGDMRNHPVGTGPFVFEELVTRDRVEFSRFEDYWIDDLPYLDSVEFLMITEPSTLVSELETGGIDILRAAPSDFIGTLEDNPDITVQKQVSPSAPRSILLNPQSEPTEGRGPDTPTADIEIRHAIQEAVDRQQFLDIVADGNGSLTQTHYHQDSPWAIDYEPYTNEANPDRARELIEDAGYTTPVELTIAANSEDVINREIATILESQLSQAGFDPDINEFTSARWIEQLFLGQYDISPIIMDDLPDPGLYAGFYYSQDQVPITAIDDPELNDLMVEMDTKFEFEERKAVFEELERHATDEAYIVWMFHFDHVHAHRNRVNNYDVNFHQLFMDTENVWVND